jgi:hypothetical protein
MYPAEGLGVTYEAADLPDTLWVNVGGTVDEEFTRDGSRYKNAENTLEIVNVGDSWRLQLISTSEDLDAGFEGCLITGDGNYTPGDDTVEDQFADTYTMSPSSLNGTPLVRTSLCVWTDEDEDGRSARLRYGEGQVAGGDPVTLGWWLGHDIALDATDFYNLNFETKKTGDQNSPVGSYTFGTGSNTYTVTISEP